MAMVLGAPLIRVFGWHTYETEGRDPMFAALARCLHEVCDYGARKGVVVALQNHNNRNLDGHGRIMVSLRPQKNSRGACSNCGEVSALEHVLAGEETMPPEKGLFLEKTWRLIPIMRAIR